MRRSKLGAKRLEMCVTYFVHIDDTYIFQISVEGWGGPCQSIGIEQKHIDLNKEGMGP